MDECSKMKKFIEDNTDITMKYLLWEETILKQNKNNDDDTTDIQYTTVD